MKFADRLKVASTGASAATLTLGSAATGCRTLAQAIASGEMNVGDTNVPFIVIDDANNWESGLYTITSSTVVTRTQILNSSNGGVAVTFSGSALSVYNSVTAFTLNSGFVNPHDVGFDVVLCPGQSNMCGRGTSDANVDIADPRVWQFGGTAGQALYRTIFSGADPLHFPEKVETGLVSPASWFGRAYAATLPTNRRVLLVPVAYGGTSLVGGTPRWNPPSGDLYTNAIAQANLAITAAQALYPNSRFVGTIWIQGETDGDNNVAQIDYVASLKAVINGFRAGITGAAGSWFVIGGMCPEVIASYPGYPAIRDAHIQVAAETSKCVYVPGPTGYRLDSFHYNAAGDRIIGARMALAVTSAKASTTTDVSSPVTGGKLTGPASGTAGTASAPFAVKLSPIGGTLAGAVRYTPSDGGAGGTFAPAFLDLTQASQSGTFTYTAAAAGNISIGLTNNASLTNPSAITFTAAASSDTTAPVMTGGVSTSNVLATSLTASWSAATDNVGVTGYEYSADMGTATWVDAGNVLTKSITGLTANTAYTIRVRAYDAAGNRATPITTSVTTAASSDTAAPVMSGSLSTSSITSSGFTISWPAASDNVAVTGYEVSINGGTSYTDVGNVLTITETGMAASTTYQLAVRAYDAAGNRATPLTGSVTTSAASSYTFESDTVGAAPTGITVTNGTLVVANSIAGTSGNSIHFTGGAISGGTGAYVGNLSNIPDITDRTVTWQRSAGNTARDGMMLRATNGTVSGWTSVRNGYMFQTSGSTGALRIYKMASSGVTSLGTFTLADAARYYRASVIGTALKFEYSTDGTNWSIALNITDATFTTGGVDYVNGFDGSNPAAAYIDTIAWS